MFYAVGEGCHILSHNGSEVEGGGYRVSPVSDSSRFSRHVKASKNGVQRTGCKYSIIIFYFRFLFCFYKSLMSNNSKEFRRGPAMLALAPSLSLAP